jgi:hypothetical protein
LQHVPDGSIAFVHRADVGWCAEDHEEDTAKQPGKCQSKWEQDPTEAQTWRQQIRQIAFFHWRIFAAALLSAGWVASMPKGIHSSSLSSTEASSDVEKLDPGQPDEIVSIAFNIPIAKFGDEFDKKLLEFILQLYNVPPGRMRLRHAHGSMVISVQICPAELPEPSSAALAQAIRADVESGEIEYAWASLGNQPSLRASLASNMPKEHEQKRHVPCIAAADGCSWLGPVEKSENHAAGCAIAINKGLKNRWKAIQQRVVCTEAENALEKPSLQFLQGVTPAEQLLPPPPPSPTARSAVNDGLYQWLGPLRVKPVDGPGVLQAQPDAALDVLPPCDDEREVGAQQRYVDWVSNVASGHSYLDWITPVASKATDQARELVSERRKRAIPRQIMEFWTNDETRQFD